MFLQTGKTPIPMRAWVLMAILFIIGFFEGLGTHRYMDEKAAERLFRDPHKVLRDDYGVDLRPTQEPRGEPKRPASQI